MTDEDIALAKHYYKEACVQYDMKLGEVFSFLKRKGLLENTVVFLLTDHGEELWSHGFGSHAFSLYEDVIHIPLAMYHPDIKAGVCTDIVSIVDIAPTILSEDFWNDGISLLSGRRSRAFAEISMKFRDPNKSETPMAKQLTWLRKEAYIEGSMKTIVTTLNSGVVVYEKYDLLSDPEERYNLGVETLHSS